MSNLSAPPVKSKKIKFNVKRTNSTSSSGAASTTSLQRRTKKNKKEYEYMCKQLEKDKIEKKNQLKKIDLVISKCKQKDYPKYVFKEGLSLKDLLDIISKQPSNNVIDLLKQFPHPGSGISKVSNTDSHVFEALWILIFYFNYDNLKLPTQTRIFKNSIEKDNIIKKTPFKFVETTYVNASNSGGIADIYFTHEDVEDISICPKCKEPNVKGHECLRKPCEFKDVVVDCGIPSCSSTNCKIIDKSKDINKNFLFSAKYFNKEKGIEHYDIPSIFIEALPKLGKFNIMLLVKDKELLKSKMDRSKKQITKSWHEIMDISDLDKYYKLLKYDLNNEKNDIDLFIKNRSTTIKKPKYNITPRFHQQYFINYSLKQFDKGNNKICWGAVPRSGKSYMIGGLIASKQPKQVVIFLGAVTETNEQFYEMFKEYSDFDNYNLVNVQKEGYKKIDIEQSNIVLISQQKGWQSSKFKKPRSLEDEDTELIQILKEKDKIIFFDEIHQGASIADAQKVLLNRYVWCTEGPLLRSRLNTKLESPFIMVTATFAKPLLKYDNIGGKTKLIQWSYEDIQLMKDINQPYKLDNFIETLESESKDIDEGILKSNIIKDLIIDLENKGITLEHLSKQYTIYPELVVLCPELEDLEKKEFVEKDKNTFDPDITFINKQSICDIIFKSNKKKFNHENSIKKFINYIRKNIYDKLLKQRFGFDVNEKIHSQLWFLPTPAGCPQTGKTKIPAIKALELKIHSTKGSIEELENELFSLKEGTQIESTTRLLAQLLTSDVFPKIRDNFCVVIINSQQLPKIKLDYSQSTLGGFTGDSYDKLTVTSYEKDSKIGCISTKCVKGNYEGSISACIEEQEACAKAKGKSIIILTGMRLRLGISLSCVDIAIHMDPIQSVDTLYQSMFRVLTERKDKKKGFFIDMLSDRFINFMYEYNNYTSKGKQKIDIKSKRTQFIEKLFSLNLNGITEYKETKKMTGIYNNLIKKMNLDSNESFAEKLEVTQEKQIIDVLDNLDNPLLLNELYDNLARLNLIFDGKQQQRKQKKPIPLMPNTDIPVDPNILVPDTFNNTQSENDVNSKEIDKKKKINTIISYIKDLFSLFILFESELLDSELSSDCNDNNIEDFLKFLKYDIKQEMFKTICDNNKTIIDCHIGFLNNKHFNLEETDPDKIITNISNLNQYRGMLITFLTKLKYEHKLEEFINFYCTIRDKFMLIKDSLNRKESKYVPKCGVLDVDGIETPKEKNNLNGGGGKELGIDENILEIIRKYLTVKDTEKKLFGEVFTPVELVCEMLEKLSSEVWKDPTLKWLDPANGIGNYPIVAYYKLMEGLKDVSQLNIDKIKREYKLDITKDKDRSKHIINNMLYMVELNPVNVKVCRKIFKMIDSNTEPNISKSNFLTEQVKWTREFKIDKFDVIMGNPPYQLKKPGNAKSQSIWPNFVENSIGCLKENGYLVFVHPSGWRNIDGGFKKIFNLIQERDLQYLTMRTFDDGAKTFGGSGTNFDHYCLKNTLTKKNKTKINDIDRNEIVLDLNNYNFIPSGKFDIFDKLIKGSEKVSILYSSNNYETRPEKSRYPTNKEKIGKFIYYVVNSITQKDGPKFIYTSTKNEMFVPKVIWSNGNGTYPIVDKKGEYGLTQFSYGIKDDVKNLEFIKNAMDDPVFIDLMKYVAYTQNIYNYKIIGAFKKDFWKEFDYKTKHKLQTRHSNITKKAPKYSNTESNISRKNNVLFNSTKKKPKPKKIRTKKPCTHEQDRNPNTGRCVKKCKPGFVRNELFKCVNGKTKKKK